MDENALPKPRMPQIKNFPFLGPVGVMLSSCIMTPERIFRSARTARGLVPIQSPSDGNIIAFPEVGGLHHRMSVAPREMGKAAPSYLFSSKIVLNSFLSKDRDGADGTGDRRVLLQ